MHYVHEQVWPSLRNKKLARAHTFSIALCVPSLIPELYAGGDVEKIENPLQLVPRHPNLGLNRVQRSSILFLFQRSILILEG